MSTYKPYTTFGKRLPILKVGHLVKVGAKMYQVVAVRPNRQTFTETGPISERALNVTTDEKYTALHGKIDVGRLVHIHTLAFSDTTDTKLYWQKDPLGSKWLVIAFNSNVAPLDAPLPVDKWSYDTEMRIAVTITSGSQTLYFETVEYEVEEYKNALSRGQIYLEITPKGEARITEVK
jgi:hypothetical protein